MGTFPKYKQSSAENEILWRYVDELGEIAVTDKADFTLSSDGQLCCLTDLCLLCFAFTSFIFFFFYLGHRHVAGLGSLTSSLSARARVYGDTRLRSLPADSGSDRTCLTLERFTVTWEDGYGHADAYKCSIRDASLESFSRVLVECHRYYEQDNTWHACVGTVWLCYGSHRAEHQPNLAITTCSLA